MGWQSWGVSILRMRLAPETRANWSGRYSTSYSRITFVLPQVLYKSNEVMYCMYPLHHCAKTFLWPPTCPPSMCALARMP